MLFFVPACLQFCACINILSGILILSVRCLMRSVTVPTREDWGQGPRMQVALSGVFGLQSRRRQRRQRKHKRALAAVCKEQPQETRTIKIEGRLRRSTYANSQTEPMNFMTLKAILPSLKSPCLLRALQRRPSYKLEGKTSSLRVVLSAVRVVLSERLTTAFSQGPSLMTMGMVGIMVNIVACLMTRLVMKKERTGTGRGGGGRRR